MGVQPCLAFFPSRLLALICLGWLSVCVAEIPAAFVKGTPFHTFVNAREVGLAPGGDPALGNYVGLFDEGYTALLLRVHLIRSARTSIDIQSFIWTNDECARVILYELVQAARRGVKVRILVDHAGSHRNPKQLAFISSLSPNIEIKVYRPLARLGAPPIHQALLDLLLTSGSNQRMHIKACIVDGVAGITGGRNIGNNYFNYSLHYNFKDRDVLVVGPAVAGMTASFNEFWSARQAVACEELRDVARQLRRGVTRPEPSRDAIYCSHYFTALDEEADNREAIDCKLLATLAPAGRVVYVADAPGRKRRFFTGLGNNGRVTDALQKLFQDAEESVVVQSPYVVMNRRLARFFRRVNSGKPDLRVMISTNSYGAADHLVTYAANYRLRPRVVNDHGMEVFEYMPYPEDFPTYLPNAAELEAMAKEEGIQRRPYLSIHAKTFVFDEDIAFIGTMNLDPRSFYLNSEDGFIIEDAAIAQRVRAGIERDMASGNSWTIARNRRPIFFVNRLLERLSARTPIDFWPLRSTSGFELRPGMEPLSSKHPDFYKHYKDIGNFPGGEGPSGAKFVVRFLKVFGKPTTPLL